MRWVFYGLLVVNIAFFAWQKMPIKQAESLPGEAEILPAGVAPIKLLSELGELGEQADIELEQRADAKKCDVYGPFFSDTDSTSFLQATAAAGIEGSQLEELVRLKPYYRLYVQPQGSKKKTQALINRLRGYQLNAQLITEGGLRNAVSLGDFESEDDIDRLRQRLSIHDIRVEVLEKSRDYGQYWVYLSPGSAALLTGSLQSELIGKYPDIFHQQKNCKPVASGG